MKKRNGFTLIELLAVITLIGLILILVVPNITDSYDRAQKNIFYDNVLNIYSSATNTYLMNIGEVNASNIFCSGGNNELNSEVSDDISYYVKVNSNGQVLEMIVASEEYIIDSTEASANIDLTKKSSIKKTDIQEVVDVDNALDKISNKCS